MTPPVKVLRALFGLSYPCCRYKTLVVQTPDLSHAKDTDNSLVPFAVDRTEEASEPGSLGAIEERGEDGPINTLDGAFHQSVTKIIVRVRGIGRVFAENSRTPSYAACTNRRKKR